MAAKAKLGALYTHFCEAVPARHSLELVGHKQPPTTMQTDNTTALGVVNSNVMKKNEINGYEIPLAPMPNQPNAIQTLLGIGEDKLSRLRHKTSPGNTSPGNKKYVPN